MSSKIVGQKQFSMTELRVSVAGNNGGQPLLTYRTLLNKWIQIITIRTEVQGAASEDFPCPEFFHTIF